MTRDYMITETGLRYEWYRNEYDMNDSVIDMIWWFMILLWIWYDDSCYDYDMNDENSWTWYEIQEYMNTVVHISTYENDDYGLS